MILTLATNDRDMFSLLWNHTYLWNNHRYLILLSNYVYDTQDAAMIQVFLESPKTKQLFNSMSLVEKEKFVQFTVDSLEKYFMDDDDENGSFNQGRGYYPPDLNESQIEQHKQDIEKVLNLAMLTEPPYSLINLTTNLLPLSIDSTVDDLMDILAQYEDNEEGQEILMITLQNLEGREKSS